MKTLDKSASVSRVEEKHLISWHDYYVLRSVLSSTMQLDRGGPYWIRSLYFDTLNLADYTEKIIGENQRKKIRLRIYSPQDKLVKLEIKNKTGKYSNKETCCISDSDAAKIIRSDFDCLKEYGNKTANKVWQFSKKDILKPSIIVDYYREAYWLPYNDIRITFDSNISVTKSKDFFSDRLSTVPICNEEQLILEVKYNCFLPKYILSILSSVNLFQTSISKYCSCLDLIKL